MKQLSILITTYNRSRMLQELVASILSNKEMASIDFELIICDDCSSDDTANVVASFKDDRLRYIKSASNVGMFKNLKNGIDIAAGRHAIIIADDDRIGDPSFYKDAINLLDKGSADLVFGRLYTFKGDEENGEVSYFPFKEFYVNDELLKEWIPSIYAMSNSCFVFKTDVLQRTYPKCFVNGNTLDHFIIYKNIKESRTIAFIDKIAYKWRRSTPTSLSGSDHDNASKLALNTLAFAFEALLDRESFDNAFFNRVVLNALSEIESNYYLSKVESIFGQFFDCNFDKINGKNIYIYGYGDVGKKFESFLSRKGIKIKSYIDDFRTGSSIVALNDIIDDKDAVIVVATFKCRFGLAMRKKLAKMNLEALDFFDFLTV